MNTSVNYFLSQNTTYPLNLPGTAMPSNGVSPTGIVGLIIQTSGIYKISYDLSYSTEASTRLETLLLVNASNLISGTSTVRDTSAGVIENVAGTAILALGAGDLVRIAARSSVFTNAFFPAFATSLTAVRIGDF